MNISLLVDDPRSGVENMAVDEALLDWSRKSNRPILRFYRWKESTLSLGYFQKYEERESHRPSREILAVRRRSGGGAIVHDRELTYSLAVPPGHAFATKQRLVLYETIHRVLIAFLNDQGIEARLVSELPEKPADHEKEFLCFKRFAAGDIVASPKSQEPVFSNQIKIVGSAQYRDRFDGVLQHGSILLDRSPAAPELPGICQIADFPISEYPEKIINELCMALEKTLSLRFSGFEQNLSSSQNKEFQETIDFYREKRYAKYKWLLKIRE